MVNLFTRSRIDGYPIALIPKEEYDVFLKVLGGIKTSEIKELVDNILWWTDITLAQKMQKEIDDRNENNILLKIKTSTENFEMICKIFQRKEKLKKLYEL